MSEDKLALDLGHEELVVLLWLLRTPTLPGLGPDPLGGLDGEVAAQALAAAERSLRARGLLAFEEDGPLQLDAVAMALVGTCVVADRTLVCATAERDGESSFRYIFSTKNLVVEHTNLEPGIHHFETIPMGDASAMRAMDALGLGELRAHDGKAVLATEQRLLELAVALSARSGCTAEPQVSTDLEIESAQAILRAFSALEKVAIIAVRRREGLAGPEAESMVLLKTAKGCWSLVPDIDGDPAILRLRPVSTEDVRVRIKVMSERVC